MHLMKGEGFMDKVLEVLLLEEGYVDCLRIYFGDEEFDDINLNSNDQSGLRIIYKKLIKLSLENKVSLNLKYQEGYNKNLFKEIADEFIRDLNTELKKISDDITLKSLDNWFILNKY